MIKLNEDQEKAAEKIVDFIEGRYDAPFFTLTGAGGTGKTVMLKEALNRTNYYQLDRSAAAVAHAAKNVICQSFGNSIPCYTVAQWLGMKMVYGKDGEIEFKVDHKGRKRLADSRVAILDEASMINDYLYNQIMSLVQQFDIKLITVGDIFQLPPVKQDHDSKFFDRIDAELTIPMRFTGPIMELSDVYRNELKQINAGYTGNPFILNEVTNRQDREDTSIGTGYFFRNNIYDLVNQVGNEIKENPDDINYSRMLAYKNETVRLLNKEVRKIIYGDNPRQFEIGEILISNGGYTKNKTPLINNGEILKIKNIISDEGPYGIPCFFLEFEKHGYIVKLDGSSFGLNNIRIPVVDNNPVALHKYNEIKERLLENAKRDNTQWVNYYKFIDSFAYFDYAYAVTLHKAQGQTIDNVYVMEGEVMKVKPLNLKQKYQALYVAVTRARHNVYIYNKDY